MFWRSLFQLAIEVIGAVLVDALFDDDGQQRGRHRRR